MKSLNDFFQQTGHYTARSLQQPSLDESILDSLSDTCDSTLRDFCDTAFPYGLKDEAIQHILNVFICQNEEDQQDSANWLLENATDTGLQKLIAPPKDTFSIVFDDKTPLLGGQEVRISVKMLSTLVEKETVYAGDAFHSLLNEGTSYQNKTGEVFSALYDMNDQGAIALFVALANNNSEVALDVISSLSDGRPEITAHMMSLDAISLDFAAEMFVRTRDNLEQLSDIMQSKYPLRYPDILARVGWDSEYHEYYVMEKARFDIVVNTPDLSKFCDELFPPAAKERALQRIADILLYADEADRQSAANWLLEAVRVTEVERLINTQRTDNFSLHFNDDIPLLAQREMRISPEMLYTLVDKCPSYAVNIFIPATVRLFDSRCADMLASLYEISPSRTKALFTSLLETHNLSMTDAGPNLADNFAAFSTFRSLLEQGHRHVAASILDSTEINLDTAAELLLATVFEDTAIDLLDMLDRSRAEALLERVEFGPVDDMPVIIVALRGTRPEWDQWVNDVHVNHDVIPQLELDNGIIKVDRDENSNEFEYLDKAFTLRMKQSGFMNAFADEEIKFDNVLESITFKKVLMIAIRQDPELAVPIAKMHIQEDSTISMDTLNETEKELFFKISATCYIADNNIFNMISVVNPLFNKREFSDRQSFDIQELRTQVDIETEKLEMTETTRGKMLTERWNNINDVRKGDFPLFDGGYSIHGSQYDRNLFMTLFAAIKDKQKAEFTVAMAKVIAGLPNTLSEAKIGLKDNFITLYVTGNFISEGFQRKYFHYLLNCGQIH